MTRTIAAVFTLLLCVTATYAQEPDCSKFVVLDETNIHTTHDLYRRLFDLLTDSRSSTEEATKEGAIKAGIPIPMLDDLIKVDVDASGKTKDFATFREDFLHRSESESMEKMDRAESYKTFGKWSAETAQVCLTSRAVGLWGYFEPSPHYQSFAFSFHYNSRPDDLIRVREVTVLSEPANAHTSCDLDHVTPSIWKSAINAAIVQSFHCVWSDSTKDIIVTVVTEFGTKSFTLGGVRPAEPVRLHMARYSMNSPASWQTSANYVLDLTPVGDSPRAEVTGAFFTAPVGAKYTVQVMARGTPCPICYSFMSVFYKAKSLDQLNKQDDPALGLDSSRIAATIDSYNTKSPNFDFNPQTVWLDKGESFWLRATPCGDTHCMGAVNATLNSATATVTWNQ